MAGRVRGTVVVAAMAGVLMGTLGACASEDDPAASAPREKSRWQTESPSRTQLKKLLLSRSELPESLQQRYTQIFPTVDGGGRQVASKRACQPLADALPGRLGGARASAKQRYAATPEEFVGVGLASYGSRAKAAAAMSELKSAVAACTSPFRIGTNAEDDDPYRGVKKKAAPGEGDQALVYYLRAVSDTDGREFPMLHVQVRVGTVVASFTRYGTYRGGDNTIPSDLVKTQVDKIQASE